MSTRQALQDALAILENEGWAQGCHARRADGTSCATIAHSASSFCISGAIWKASGGVYPLFKEALKAVQNQLDCPNVATWNDYEGRTFDQVREVIRRAAGESSARDFFGGVFAADGSGQEAA